jgi:hypothetical protein
VIAIEFTKQDSANSAKSQNQTGVWYFLVTHANGKRRLSGKEDFFVEKGTWEEAQAKAQVTAKTYGCVDGVDSILVFHFTTD